ncbi:hypothetical protein [Streptacidiphilus sp. EB103A]|uniref:hypothetical protein n=1 Tax=Streptacidiphilus sp. EB103A TaxID=3156275 RepID=UPI003514518A
MPYAVRTRVRPLPRRPRPRAPRRFASVVPAGTGQTLAQQLNGWAGTAQIYISFDGPATINPAWLDVTGFVDQTVGITINPGRADGLSDANATTCSLTVDNTDGRWTPGNPSGVWNGLIRKGCWLRVDLLPLSGTVSRRFTGYLNNLPTVIEGQTGNVALGATDRFGPLSQAPKLPSMIVAEWLSDPVGAPLITGYWPLHEPAGATYASDISGQAPAGRQALTVRNFSVSPGSGITWSKTPAPGFDQQSTIAFTPSGTVLPQNGGGNTNALSKGSYLQGTIPLAAIAHITCWINTTTGNQPIWSWSDPTSNYAFGIDLSAAGFLEIWQAPLSGSNGGTYALNAFQGPLSRTPLNDGVWHQISVRIQTPAATGGTSSYYATIVDGYQTFTYFGSNNPVTDFSPPPAQSRFLIGAAEGWNADVSTNALAFYTGSISDLVVHQFADHSINVDWYNPWIASATGHSGDLTGLRLARLASYAGLATPMSTFLLPGNGLPAQQPTTGTSGAVTVGTTAHQCGPQAIAGQNPLETLRVPARTEFMPLFADAYGRITLQPSTLRQNPVAAVTIAAVDLDKATAWADDFQYVNNQMAITPAGQGQVTVTAGGAASQALFGVYEGTLATASLNAAEAASLGAAAIGGGANPPTRPAPLAVEAGTLALQPGYGAAWYDAVLALTVSGLIAVTGWTQQSPYGAGGSSSHIVEGWTETIQAGTHLFAWSTSAPQGPTYQLDSPTLGLLDTPGITLAY